MAFLAPLVPLLASIGGGSAVAGGVMLGTTLASGAMSAISARNAGIAQDQQYKYQAYTEGLAAKQREIDRRRDLIKSLSSMNAVAGTGGIELGGSLGGIIMKNIKDNQNDLLVNDANLSATQQALKAAGANARQQGNTQAALSLLDTGKNVFGMIKPKAKLG